MFVSYAFSVAIIVSVFVTFNVLSENPNVKYMIIVAIGMAFALSPISLRWSRSIWASIFFSYDKNAIKKFKEGSYEV